MRPWAGTDTAWQDNINGNRQTAPWLEVTHSISGGSARQEREREREKQESPSGHGGASDPPARLHTGRPLFVGGCSCAASPLSGGPSSAQLAARIALPVAGGQCRLWRRAVGAPGAGHDVLRAQRSTHSHPPLLGPHHPLSAGIRIHSEYLLPAVDRT